MIDAITSATSALTQSLPGIGGSAPSGATGGSSDFAKIATEFADTMRAGENAAIAGITGELPLQQTIEKVLSAERSLSAAVAIRDKIVNAYLELSRMQI